MDLSGTWRAALADDDLRRVAFGLGFDDAGWAPVEVPGHWRSAPALAGADGPVIYRAPRFEVDPGPPGARHWVVLDGAFYQADVWLDGAYLGDQEGYFAPHAYEITDLARLGREHVLAVEVANPPQRDKRAKRTITGVFGHWDCLDPDDNVGGLWRPVRIERTGPVRIERMRVLCREATPDRAVVDVHARLDTDVARAVRVRTAVDGAVEREHEFGLARGVNDLTWSFGVEDPPLWWPWSLGDQRFVHVEVSVAVEHVVSHARTVRTGLRQVGMRRDWVLSVNGERLYVKGANLAPTRARLADATPAEMARDAALARDAGLDLVRIHGHVARPELYDAADDAGLLVWQDFPLQWGYDRTVRRNAVRQAEEMVDLLGHHPSIALWCGHNEPFRLDVEPGRERGRHRGAMRFVAGHELPSWNKTILDRWVKRAIEVADPSRPVIAHSGVAPHPPQLDGTDSHLSFGWFHGDERDLPRFAAAVPRMVRFVGEFGAPSVPDADAFCEPERWPDLDWDRLGRTHGLAKPMFDERVPPGAFADFDGWRAATQRYQAELVRHHVETLRRLKYRPNAGFCVFFLADAHEAVSWSLLDHERNAKLAYHALVESCRPVIVVAERLPAAVAPGDALALDVHVISDLHRPLVDVEVAARLWWPGGEHRWRYAGTVGPDACERVGTLAFVVPDRRGDLVLDLELAAPDDLAATNRYTAPIVPPAPDA
jgi:beta-mannosidase